MRRLSAAGTTILFISHRMPEVREICNSLTVLRNGRDVGTFQIERHIRRRDYPARHWSHACAGVSAEIGSRSTAGKAGTSHASPEESCNDASAYGTFRLSSGPERFSGLLRLQGMGQLELFRSAFGLEPIESGTMEIDGQKVTLSSPHDAIKAHIGLSLVPEDRKTEALFLKLSGRANVSLPVIDRFARFGWIFRNAEDRAVLEALELVNVPISRHVHALRRLQWRQPAKDSHCEMASRAVQGADDVRPNAGR